MSTPSLHSRVPSRCSPGLSRYTHRVARRLISFDEASVTFRYKDYRRDRAERYRTMTLATEEFIRRFMLHVLPKGFHRIRHHGLLASAGRKANVARARSLLAVPPVEPAEPVVSDLSVPRWFAGVALPRSVSAVGWRRRATQTARLRSAVDDDAFAPVASEAPTVIPSIPRRPSSLTPTAMITATDKMRPAWRTFDVGGVEPEVEPVAFQLALSKVFTRSSISPYRRLT